MAETTPWKQTFTEGLILIVIGIIAIILPQIFTFGIEVVIGVLLIIAGLVLGYRAFTGECLKEGLYLGFMAILTTLIGILLLVYPTKGALAITVILTIYFFIEGLTKLIMAARARNSSFWVWYLLSGLIAIVLAAVVWAGWPESSTWLMGLLVGINLIFFGCARVALALSIR